jgi:nitrate/nitrite-specific signal transduction histidine kinase
MQHNTEVGLFTTPPSLEETQELAVLFDIGSDLTRSLSPTEILDRAILKVLEHFEVAAVRIHLMDEAEKCLELVAYKGIAKGPVGRTASNWGH